MVEQLRAHDSMATFEINETGDLTDEEFHRMQGLVMPYEVELNQDDAGS